ncbi:hypothetical protein ACRS6B_19915 [Nocardia asteroides]
MGDERDPVGAGRYLLTGRSLSEYRAMFALTGDDLRGDVLDCPGGAAAFAAEAAALARGWSRWRPCASAVSTPPSWTSTSSSSAGHVRCYG